MLFKCSGKYIEIYFSFKITFFTRRQARELLTHVGNQVHLGSIEDLLPNPANKCYLNNKFKQGYPGTSFT